MTFDKLRVRESTSQIKKFKISVIVKLRTSTDFLKTTVNFTLKAIDFVLTSVCLKCIFVLKEHNHSLSMKNTRSTTKITCVNLNCIEFFAANYSPSL